jgi:hypothetical protein
MNAPPAGHDRHVFARDSRLQVSMNAVIARLGPQRLLVVSGHPASLPKIDFGHCGYRVLLGNRGDSGFSMLDCRRQALPFTDGAFNMVIAHHVLSDGDEEELDEFERVLTGNGQLLVIGSGIFGVHQGSGLPVIQARSLCTALQQRSFRVRQCEGEGIRGRSVYLHKQWQRPLLPLADRIMVRARHTRQRPLVTPLKFASPQVAGARSTALESFNRQAAG